MIIPFNYRTSANQVRNQSDGQITISSARYAMVKICCGVDGTFLVNGETLIDRTVRPIAFGEVNGTLSCTINSCSVAYTQAVLSEGFIGDACLTVGGSVALVNTFASGINVDSNIYAGNGQQICVCNYLPGLTDVSGYQDTEQADWVTIIVPPSSTLEATVNCKYIVEEYSE